MPGLPVFRYHPDPVASGSVRESGECCACCGRARGYIYAGPVYSEEELDDKLCPWCIADGQAHAKFDASFTDDASFPDDVPPPIVEEVTWRTPGFSGWQQEHWLGCCGDAAAFIEPFGYREIGARWPQMEGALMMYIVHEMGISGVAATRFLRSLDRDHSPTAYLFRCLHCARDLFYIDFL